MIPESNIGRVIGYADDFIIMSSSTKCAQERLSEFEKFCEVKGLLINATKCKVMTSCTMHHHRCHPNEPKPEFLISDNILEYVKEYKYLGYIINSSFSDKAHTQQIFSKFSRTVPFFKLCLKERSIKLLLKLTRMFLLPTLHSLEFVQKFTPGGKTLKFSIIEEKSVLSTLNVCLFCLDFRRF